MKVALRLGVIVFFLAATAFARTPASRQTALSDHQLDAITAGAEDDVVGGGAIVVDNSSATLGKKGTVSLDTSAQKDARALNLVNSASGAVANGVNVWDGRLRQGGEDLKAPNLKVSQDNKLLQTGGGVASLPSYSNGGRLETKENGGGTLSKTNSTRNENKVNNIMTKKTTVNVTSEGNVNALTKVLGQDLQIGRGLAASGELDVHFDPTTFHFEANAAIANLITGKVIVDIGLPGFFVKATGSGCAVQNGSCFAKGTTNKSTEKLTDKSTFTLITSSSSENSSNTFNKSSTEIRPVTLTNPRAEIIVADNSKLTSNNDFSVTLKGLAQQNARALNIVNAAGSLVANGVNVARTPTLGPNIAIALNQSNVISQHL